LTEQKTSKKPTKGLTLLVRDVLKEICDIPPMEDSPELYVDWGEKEKFRVKTAKGECAA